MMKIKIHSALFCGLLLATAPVYGQTADSSPGTEPDMTVALINQHQEQVGQVEMYEGPEGYVLAVEVNGMSEGWHGFHIHEIGDCSDHETFKSAGGHAVAVPEQQHGFLDEVSPHIGDLPNLWVNETGTGKAQLYTAMQHGSLADLDGSAFVFHGGADDYKTESSGESGNRVACGVIFPPKVVEE